MPELMEDPGKYSIGANNDWKTEFDTIQIMMNDLRQNLHVDFTVNTGTRDGGSNIRRVSQEFYSNLFKKDEWSELIKSLRVADGDIHLLKCTNTYLEHHLNAYCEDVVENKKCSKFISDRLNELSRFETEFNRAVCNYLPPAVVEESKRETKNVKFERIPRKSKSVAGSVDRMCLSYGLKLDRQLPRRDKFKRKKSYGKYCSSCGAIEVPSQNSVIRCCDCDGEIIIQGLCSSCDSFKGRLLPKENGIDDKFVDKGCSTCDFLRKKRICWDDKKICNKCKKGKVRNQERAFHNEDKYKYPNAIAPKFVNYVEASSCCSDCDLTSSCDTSLTECKHKFRLHNLSADSLVPLSDSDNRILNTRIYSHDYDVSSSISSSATEMRKDCFKVVASIPPVLKVTQSAHEPLSRVNEEDEEFNSPREYFSAEDMTITETESEPSLESTLVDFQSNTNSEEEKEEGASNVNSNNNDKSADFEECIEAAEPADELDANEIKNATPPGGILLGDVVNQQPDLFAVSDRLHRAEEALAHIAEGGTKLEAGILAMEDISQENWKLSMTLQEIMLGLASQLDYVHCSSFDGETFNADVNSESSGEFEEALEDVHSSAASEADEIFYDIPTANHLYLCLECGIETCHEALVKCPTCGKALTEITNGVLNQELSFSLESSSSTILKALPLNDLTSQSSNYEKKEAEELRTANFPVFVKGNFSCLSLSALKNRLKQIDKETSLLNDNNDIISVLIDDLKKKTTIELKSIQTANVLANRTDPETTLFGFDVSIYQFRRLLTESIKNTDVIAESAEEEVCQRNRTFLEMKFEEVFKKEQQTALELEIFEQKLEVEGLIIKETEDYFTCSNTSQAVEKIDDAMAMSFVLSRDFKSEKFQTVKTPTENDGLLISIEIEVEKESNGNQKQAIRCEYKANVQKKTLKDQSYIRRVDREKTLPTVTMYPVWKMSKHDRRGLNREHSSHENKQVTFRGSSRDSGKLNGCHSDEGIRRGEPYLFDVEREDLVEIKAPNRFYGSSDEETESYIGDTGNDIRKKFHSVAAVRMPVAIYPVTEIRLTETPFAVLNSNKRTTCQMREFSRISQIELEESPQSGVVFVQTKAVSSLGVTECPSTTGDSFEEFYETKSQYVTSDTSLHRSGKSTWENGSLDSILWKEVITRRKSSCQVKFIPINMGGSSVASIRLPDETLPVLITENLKHIEELPRETEVNTTPQFKREDEELARALSLIREIENDVVEVKLHNAIAILPELESILREHLQEKMEGLKKKSSTMTKVSSLDVFMSTLNFITEDAEVSIPSSIPSETATMKDVESDERLGKMLQLLTGLEQAIRQINTTEESSSECCNANAGHIYDLLQALSSRIKGIGDEPDVSEMEKTLELTSELDIAVRDYSSELQKKVSGSETSQDTYGEKLTSPKSSGGFLAANKLKTMKKKIFDVVAAEARERETRVERDFDRIARLEKENVEVMRFLDMLLDKTLRRVGELDEIRVMGYTLSQSMKDLAHITESRKEEVKPVTASGQEIPQIRLVKMGRTPTLPSIQEVWSDNRTSESSEEDKSEIMKDTLSDMIVALDNLKSRATEKKKLYKEIFGEEAHVTTKPLPFASNSDSSSINSNRITQFNRIGTNAYYMTWTKPEIEYEDYTITGYEIWVNGRVNQRVRNPERLKAVLYSANPVTPHEKLKINLFALTDTNRRLSIADLKYP